MSIQSDTAYKLTEHSREKFVFPFFPFVPALTSSHNSWANYRAHCALAAWCMQIWSGSCVPFKNAPREGETFKSDTYTKGNGAPFVLSGSLDCSTVENIFHRNIYETHFFFNKSKDNIKTIFT